MKIKLSHLLKSAVITTGLFLANSFALNAQDDTGKNLEIVENVIENIQAQYPIEDTANELNSALSKFANSPGFADLDEASFLEEMNAVMKEASNDLHLRIATAEAVEQRMSRAGGRRTPTMRRVARGQAYQPLGTSKVRAEMLNERTGLIDFDSAIYRNPDLFADALDAVASADNIVLDLRGVPGGSVPGVAYFLSQFYAEPTHLSSRYSRRFDRPQELWTVETPHSKVFADKNLYVLTNKRSASGAEAVAFALRNSGRATLVGEKTAGAGNAGAFVDVGEGLMLFLPISQTIDPKTGKAWEATGVMPHVEVPADEALDAALELISRST
ncbi:MAG: S41 family peptidase [Kordiimonadaceae bacterium]|nr:S41 family peptidase [Kordiimonadaceae bacterium]